MAYDEYINLYNKYWESSLGDYKDYDDNSSYTDIMLHHLLLVESGCLMKKKYPNEQRYLDSELINYELALNTSKQVDQFNTGIIEKFMVIFDSYKFTSELVSKLIFDIFDCDKFNGEFIAWFMTHHEYHEYPQSSDRFTV